MDSSFWHNKRVLVTGHTGFKGGWLSLWLKNMDAKVYGYSKAPDSYSKFYFSNKLSSCFESEKFGDILDTQNFENFVEQVRPEIVYHLAAQPLVLEGYDNPVDTFRTNVSGVISVLEVFRKVDYEVALINITSDKCYRNHGKVDAYREDSPLGGLDPYSASKACSEIISGCYRDAYFEQSGVQLATARAGNVIGGGDAALNRLLPDLMRAFDESKPIEIRNPNAVRPWQHVLEALSGYILLAENMLNYPNKFNSAWNFGPLDQAVSVRDLIGIFTNLIGNVEIIVNSQGKVTEAQQLQLDVKKAKTFLDWQPKLSVEKAVEMTAFWHKESKLNTSMVDFSITQILEYLDFEQNSS